MLYVLVAEALNRMVLRAQDVGLFTGFQVSSFREAIPVIQCADYTLLLIDANEASIEHLMAVLLWFAAISGLSMNSNKTKLFKVGNCQDFDILMAECGCLWRTLPTAYVGLLLAAGFKSSEMWKPLIDRFRQRLAVW